MARQTSDCFLVLMADQLAASWLPIYGHPVVQAPHLSALARGATVFDSAYCAYPLCAPSRAAMLTGRYASAVGVVTLVICVIASRFMVGRQSSALY